MKTLSVKVSEDVYRAFEELARRKGMSPTQLLKQLVLEAIKKELDNDSISSLHTYQDKVMELEERLRSLEEKLTIIERFLRSRFGLQYERFIHQRSR